jgi:hypothetical protein
MNMHTPALPVIRTRGKMVAFIEFASAQNSEWVFGQDLHCSCTLVSRGYPAFATTCYAAQQTLR